jgi:hypothetical protein
MANDQWFSPDLSNLVRVLSAFLRAALRRALPLVFALFLTGCTSDWTPYVSGDEGLSFVRRVGCIMGSNYDEHPDNLAYHVVKLERGSADVFDIIGPLNRVAKRACRAGQGRHLAPDGSP